MKEDLIQYFWNSKTLAQQALFTTTGEKLVIRSPGLLNADQGPDFLFARIEIGGVLWVGHVEIHVRSSDWNLHGHVEDPHYNNTILHVVWESNTEIQLHGSPLACLEIKDYLPRELFMKYEQLMLSELPIPCHHQLTNVSDSLKAIFIERLMIERFEVKTKKILQDWQNLGSDWEALLFHKIATYLVAPVNMNAMEALLCRVPFTLLNKYKHDLFMLEALLLGTAGLLQAPGEDQYAKALKKDFQFLQKKHLIHSLDPVEWKFLRMRPAHFPSLRLAQLASMLHSKELWLSFVLETDQIKDLIPFFKIEPSSYWKMHYHFGKTSAKTSSRIIGDFALNVVFINAVCPVLFAYGSIQSEEKHCQKALRFLETLKVESNRITHMWKNYNFVLRHAGHSQAGIQLYQSYCVHKKCTSCMIGNVILKCGVHSDSNQANF
ncbi:MAG: DUF2851 family protein [Saprospiraceae bacterium]|nr:DUF2851 family protein [Saprospiraceae bacterium]